MSPLQLLQKAIGTLKASYASFHERAPFKLPYIGLLGLGAHPIYYLVWTYWLKQEYESPELRLVSMLFCSVLAAERWWPEKLKPYYLAFGYFSLLFSLPFFFTFMLLMNNGSNAWLMSTTVATLFVVQLYDFRNGMVVLVVGNLAAVSAYLALEGWVALPEPFLLSIPIYAFAISAIGFLTYSERQISGERLLAAQALASNIAHEMRTPLLGIRLDCERIQEDYEVISKVAGLSAEGTSSELEELVEIDSDVRGALLRILQHSEGACMAIDMILLKVKHDRFSKEEFQVSKIGDVIRDAIARYPFRKGEREAVRVDIDHDFDFFGSKVLFVHVLFNLLKNSLAMISVDRGDMITITTNCIDGVNSLIVNDNGPGIPKEIQKSVFTPFATSGRYMEGTGLGLAFCKHVVESFQGSIHFQTVLGEGTTIIIELPPVVPSEPPIGSNDQQGSARSRCVA